VDKIQGSEMRDDVKKLSQDLKQSTNMQVTCKPRVIMTTQCIIVFQFSALNTAYKNKYLK